MNDIGIILTDFEQYISNRLKGYKSQELYMILAKEFLLSYDIEDTESIAKYIVKKTVEKKSYACYYMIIKLVNFYYDVHKQDSDKKTKIIKMIKMLKPQIKDRDKIHKQLSEEQSLKVILNLEEERHQIIALIQKLTGARVSEVLWLHKYDKSNDSNIMYDVVDKQLCLSIKFKKTKGNIKHRHVNIFNQYFADIIWNYLRENVGLDDYFLFCDRSRVYKHNQNNNHQVVDRNYRLYRQDLIKACRKVGIDSSQFTSHSWRSNFITNVYIESGSDLYATKELSGHARIETLMRYINKSIDRNKLLKKVQVHTEKTSI